MRPWGYGGEPSVPARDKEKAVRHIYTTQIAKFAKELGLVHKKQLDITRKCARTKLCGLSAQTS